MFTVLCNVYCSVVQCLQQCCAMFTAVLCNVYRSVVQCLPQRRLQLTLYIQCISLSLNVEITTFKGRNDSNVRLSQNTYERRSWTSCWWRCPCVPCTAWCCPQTPWPSTWPSRPPSPCTWGGSPAAGRSQSSCVRPSPDPAHRYSRLTQRKSIFDI